MNIKNYLIVGTITLTAAFGFIGCGNSSQSTDKLPLMDVSEDGKTVYANFDKTDIGTAAGSGVTIDEGEYLIIDSGITEGAVQVKVTAGGDDINEVPSSDNPATIDYEFSSVGTTEYQEIASGSYTVFVETTEKTTGTITFSVVALPNAEDATLDDGTVYFAKDVDEGVALENLEDYLNQGN